MNVITDTTTISVILLSYLIGIITQFLCFPVFRNSLKRNLYVPECMCMPVCMYIFVYVCVWERDNVYAQQENKITWNVISHFFNIVCFLKVNFNKEQITISYVNYLTWFLEYNEHLTKGDFFSAMTPGIFISCSLSKCLLLKFKSNQDLLFNLAEQNIYFKDKTCKSDMLRFFLNFALRFTLLSVHIIQTRNDI